MREGLVSATTPILSLAREKYISNVLNRSCKHLLIAVKKCDSEPTFYSFKS